MISRVLVAYAGKAGSTAEAARVIADELTARKMCADVRGCESVESLEGYDAIVIGSAIRAGRPLPAAMKFRNNFLAQLRKMPVAAFAVCLAMEKDSAGNRARSEAYLMPLGKGIKPLAMGAFAGRMKYQSLDAFSRFIIKRLARIPEGDYFDTEAIRQWAKGLHDKLQTGQ